MKNYLIIFFILISPIIHAQTVDEIIAFTVKNNQFSKHVHTIESIGYGNIANSGGGITIRNIFSNQKYIYQEINISNITTVKQYCDNKTGWKAVYVNDKLVQSATLIGTEYKKLAQYMDLSDDFDDYQKRGIKLSLEDTDSLENKKVYKIKALRPNNTIAYHYFDASNFYEIKTIEHRADGEIQTTLFRNFFTDKSGAIFPEVVESDWGTIHYTDYKLNPKISKKMFEQPK